MYTESQKQKLKKASAKGVAFSEVKVIPPRLDRAVLMELFWIVAKNDTSGKPYSKALHAVLDRIEQRSR